MRLVRVTAEAVVLKEAASGRLVTLMPTAGAQRVRTKKRLHPAAVKDSKA
jgi:hypothetical protein